MWIMSSSGFVSVVEYKYDSSKLLVRARVPEDLMTLVTGADQIEKNDQADYMYRTVVTREKFAEWVTQQINSIWYTSHAKEAMTNDGQDLDRYQAYLRVWDAMFAGLDERA